MASYPPPPQHDVGFSAAQIPPLLRALADPEGRELSPDDAASIRQIEANLARLLSPAREHPVRCENDP